MGYGHLRTSDVCAEDVWATRHLNLNLVRGTLIACKERNLLESNPLKSRFLVHGLTVCDISWQLPGGVGTNGVVAEVPQFTLMNFHGKMSAKCGNILQNVTTCGNISQNAATCAHSKQILQTVRDVFPSVKAPVVPTPSESRWIMILIILIILILIVIILLIILILIIILIRILILKAAGHVDAPRVITSTIISVTMVRSISEISSCCFGPRPETLAHWNPTSCQRKSTIKLRIRIHIGFETLKLRIRRLKLWKPTVAPSLVSLWYNIVITITLVLRWWWWWLVLLLP